MSFFEVDVELGRRHPYQRRELYHRLGRYHGRGVWPYAPQTSVTHVYVDGPVQETTVFVHDAPPPPPRAEQPAERPAEKPEAPDASAATAAAAMRAMQAFSAAAAPKAAPEDPSTVRLREQALKDTGYSIDPRGGGSGSAHLLRREDYDAMTHNIKRMPDEAYKKFTEIWNDYHTPRPAEAAQPAAPHVPKPDRELRKQALDELHYKAVDPRNLNSVEKGILISDYNDMLDNKKRMPEDAIQRFNALWYAEHPTPAAATPAVKTPAPEKSPEKSEGGGFIARGKDGQVRTDYPDHTAIVRNAKGEVTWLKGPGDKELTTVTRSMRNDTVVWTNGSGVQALDYSGDSGLPGDTAHPMTFIKDAGGKIVGAVAGEHRDPVKAPDATAAAAITATAAAPAESLDDAINRVEADLEELRTGRRPAAKPHAPGKAAKKHFNRKSAPAGAHHSAAPAPGHAGGHAGGHAAAPGKTASAASLARAKELEALQKDSLHKDSLMPATVHLNGKEVPLETALRDPAFNKTFRENLRDAEKQGGDKVRDVVHRQLGRIDTFDTLESARKALLDGKVSADNAQALPDTGAGAGRGFVSPPAAASVQNLSGDMKGYGLAERISDIGQSLGAHLHSALAFFGFEDAAPAPGMKMPDHKLPGTTFV